MVVVEDEMCEKLRKANGIENVFEWLGTGGFSSVFRCQCSGIHDQVAVKVLKYKDALPGRGKEAEFLQGLQHPHLVNVLGHVDDPQCILLELCSGGSLQAALYTSDVWEDVPASDRLRAGCDIASGLNYLHAEGILHRDLKPGNVFLHTPIIVGEALPMVKLGDLGLARPCCEFDIMTQGVGTLRYMAPEVLESGQYSLSADIYSFGLMLHELLTGNEPFCGKGEARVVLMVAAGERPPFNELYMEMSDLGEDSVQKLWLLMEACWDGDSDSRRDAGSVLETLHEVYES